MFLLDVVLVSPSQPSADKVKEVTAFSKECVEKIERLRAEKDYHEVDSTAQLFVSLVASTSYGSLSSRRPLGPLSGCEAVP